MPSIPVDVLREILGYVRRADLATLCRVNKIVCSCSQNVLYRNIEFGNKRVIQTLAQSTDLARQVRSFRTYCNCEELATALQNMSSLRRLVLDCFHDENASILDGCTFKLDSFDSAFPYSESHKKFLNGQPSLTNVAFRGHYEFFPPFDERCLPNLTCVVAKPSWFGLLIPGRPVREVMVDRSWDGDTIDLSIFTLSTAPIRKFEIAYELLYQTPGSHLASIFPSLEHLTIKASEMNWDVRIPRLYLSI